MKRDGSHVTVGTESPLADNFAPSGHEVVPLWTFEQAQALIVALERYSQEVGWHFALAGGVLRNGKSDHDLDIIAYPRTSTKSDRENLYFLLTRMHWHRRMTAKELHKHWKAKGGKDRKHVEVWMVNGKRVDLFILGDRRGWFK